MTTILLIDDEPDTVTIYALLLEMSGYKVSQALDGAQGLRSIAISVPDVVVTDWMMPGMSGQEMCEELRREGSPHAAIPIIVASAAMQPPDGAQRLYDRFVRKPVMIDELIRVIEDCCPLLDRQAHSICGGK